MFQLWTSHEERQRMRTRRESSNHFFSFLFFFFFRFVSWLCGWRWRRKVVIEQSDRKTSQPFAKITYLRPQPPPLPASWTLFGYRSHSPTSMSDLDERLFWCESVSGAKEGKKKGKKERKEEVTPSIGFLKKVSIDEFVFHWSFWFWSHFLSSFSPIFIPTLPTWFYWFTSRSTRRCPDTFSWKNIFFKV